MIQRPQGNKKPRGLFMQTYPPPYRGGTNAGEGCVWRRLYRPTQQISMRQKRPDHEGPQRSAFEKNKRKLLMSQNICGICGKPVDKRLKYPDPMSACIDHIIPIDRGGDPSAIENLQLAHMYCNRQKSDRLLDSKKDEPKKKASNRDLPLSLDWTKYRSDE